MAVGEFRNSLVPPPAPSPGGRVARRGRSLPAPSPFRANLTKTICSTFRCTFLCSLFCCRALAEGLGPLTAAESSPDFLPVS